jgi:hypothetical protein
LQILNKGKLGHTSDNPYSNSHIQLNNCIQEIENLKTVTLGFHHSVNEIYAGLTLHSIHWYLVTDISEQFIGYIFKGQGVQEEWTEPLKKDILPLQRW